MEAHVAIQYLVRLERLHQNALCLVAMRFGNVLYDVSLMATWRYIDSLLQPLITSKTSHQHRHTYQVSVCHRPGLTIISIAPMLTFDDAQMLFSWLAVGRSLLIT